MAKSLFSVITQVPGQGIRAKNVLGEPKGGKSALQVAIRAALLDAGTGASVQSAIELGGRPIDQAVSTVPGQQAVYSIQYRVSGGTAVPPMLVLAEADTQEATVDLAVSAAQSAGVPNSVVLIGKVDIDATVQEG